MASLGAGGLGEFGDRPGVGDRIVELIELGGGDGQQAGAEMRFHGFRGGRRFAGNAQHAAFGHAIPSVDRAQAALEGGGVAHRMDILQPFARPKPLRRQLVIGADRLIENHRPVEGVEDGENLLAEAVPKQKQQERVRRVGGNLGHEGLNGCIGVKRRLLHREFQIEPLAQLAHLPEEPRLLLLRFELVAGPREPAFRSP